MATAAAHSARRRKSTRKTLHSRLHANGKLWVLWAVLLLAIGLIGARLYLPTYLKDYVNEKLNETKGYRGSVDDIDVHLYRGAYVIKGLVFNKIDKGIPVPFIKIATTDISLQWGALFHGRIVSDLHLTRPEINFAVSRSGTTSQTGAETNWNPLIDSLVPIDINFIDVTNGKVSYRDFSASPQVNLYISDVDGRITNMKNVEDKGVALPSDIHVKGKSIGGGRLAIDGKLNTLKKFVDMDVDTKLEGAKLDAFNDFSNACCAVEFRKGSIDIYSELAIQNRQLDGYLKLLVRDLAVDKVTENSNPFSILWANIAAILFEVFENQPRDQFATKIPLTGSVGSVSTQFWPAVTAIFRNAFVQAFEKGTDNEVSFGKEVKQQD